jgi:hypothetical protein
MVFAVPAAVIVIPVPAALQGPLAVIGGLILALACVATAILRRHTPGGRRFLRIGGTVILALTALGLSRVVQARTGDIPPYPFLMMAVVMAGGVVFMRLGGLSRLPAAIAAIAGALLMAKPFLLPLATRSRAAMRAARMSGLDPLNVPIHDLGPTEDLHGALMIGGTVLLMMALLVLLRPPSAAHRSALLTGGPGALAV